MASRPQRRTKQVLVVLLTVVAAADNACLGGAKASRHLSLAARDLEPVASMRRAALTAKLCALHARRGAAKAMGRGVDRATPFHIDCTGFRTWGRDYHRGSSPCLAALHKLG